MVLQSYVTGVTILQRRRVVLVPTSILVTAIFALEYIIPRVGGGKRQRNLRNKIREGERKLRTFLHLLCTFVYLYYEIFFLFCVKPRFYAIG